MEDEIIEEKIEDKNIKELVDDRKEKFLYYTNPKDILYKHKKTCLIYGIIIFVLTSIIFVSDFFFKFGTDYILDYYVSLSMFVDFYVGILYISRYKRLKDEIKANHILNLVNLKQYEENNLTRNKRTISISRILSILSMPLNISLITMYGMIIYWDITDYNIIKQVIGYVTLILVIVLSLFIIFTNIMVLGEEELYKDTEYK